MDYELFEAGEVELQSGEVLPRAQLAYKVHGRLNHDRSNVVLYPTRYSGKHSDNEFLIGSGMALDPTKYFIVAPNLLGNGVSSSPTNTPPPCDRGNFPHVTIWDNVTLQRRLLEEKFGIERLALAVGWSMGGQQAYQWAARYPDAVDRLAPICGSARTSPHNYVFLEGMKAALTADAGFADGWYDEPPIRGLRAMGRAWAGWATSQAWFRLGIHRKMGYDTVDDFLVGYWERLFLERDPNNLLALLWTWEHADISANRIYKRDFERALSSISARAIVMPGATDLYFHVDDSAYEVEHMPKAQLRPIPSVWGHYAGSGRDPAATKFINSALHELLAA